MNREHMQCEYARQMDGSHLGWDGAGFHYAIQNSRQFKTYEMFISRTFHLILQTTVDLR